MFLVPVLWRLRQENAWDSLTTQTSWTSEFYVPTERTLKTNKVDGYWETTPDVCLCPTPGAFKHTHTFKCVPHMPLNMNRPLHVSPLYIWTQTHKHLYVSPLFTWICTHIRICPVNVPEQTHISLYPHVHLNIQTYLHVSLTCTWTYTGIYMSHMCTWTYKHIYMYLPWEHKYEQPEDTYIHTY